MITLIRIRFQNFVDDLSEEKAAYFLAFVLFIAVIILNQVISFLGIKLDFSLFWLSFIVMIYGFMRYVLDVIKLLNETLLGKGFNSVVVIFITTFCLAFSNVFINDTLNVPSLPFGYTQTLVSLLVSPIVVSLVFFFSIMMLLPISLIASSFRIKKINAKLLLSLRFRESVLPTDISLLLGRFGTVLFLLSLSIGFLQDNKWYSEQVSMFTNWFAYNFEMETYTYCDVPLDSKVAYLKGKNIIIASNEDGTYHFKVIKCNSKL